MALERVPSDIRKEGGVARMSPVSKIREIMAAVSIPVMAKARIGHFMEARILEALGVDYIDESEVLTPADEEHHIAKRDFKVPFVCGARNLGEALRRIAEGAAMIRTKGEAGSGNIVEAVRHIRTIVKEMRQLTVLGKEELVHESKNLQAPLDLVEWVAEHGKLPVPNFSAGGIATPADAALVMQLGAEAVFVGSGIFKSDDPEARAKAIVKATTYYNDPQKLLEASEDLGMAMPGLDISKLPEERIDADAGLVALADPSGAMKKRRRRSRAAGRFRSPRESAATAPGARCRFASCERAETTQRPRRPGDSRRRKHHHAQAAAITWTSRSRCASFAREKPVFGTCAGAILLAKEVQNPEQESFGVVDLDGRTQRLRPPARQPRRPCCNPRTISAASRRGRSGSGLHPRSDHPPRPVPA